MTMKPMYLFALLLAVIPLAYFSQSELNKCQIFLLTLR